ncbi:MAG: DUF3427 domain-containing protein [Pseudomonadales bacterium]
MLGKLPAGSEVNCPFCNPETNRIFYEDETVLCLWDLYPVSPGHALIVTRRHIPTWFDATPAELAALFNGIEMARSAIITDHVPADGFNIGVNIGAAAGQTIDHLHVHVIPRRAGDVEDPRGGVRYVIPERANYLANPSVRDATMHHVAARSVSGTERLPFLETLRLDLERASRFDLAVAFITEAGLSELRPYMEDLLFRNGRIRLLTGDYMDVTEPRALYQILDWTEEYPDHIQARVFVTERLGFHPKAYVLHDSQRSTAYIGSSNLTKHALLSGIEWNQRISTTPLHGPIRQIETEFEALFAHQNSIELSADWIAQYDKRRPSRPSLDAGLDIEEEPIAPPVKPHGIQQEALDALTATRQAGNSAGLVVLATGLGKTWLSAFDSAAYKRVLFVAHREEILEQAFSTFRRIRPMAALGRYAGGRHDRQADVLFASVQTLGRREHLQQFGAKTFNYIVIDEFHHAAAATYRRLIDHFEPDFLLGLTATPERSDGGDLLSLCGENLVFRCDLVAGINRSLLSPFRYVGVPDEVDFANIPWRSGRFDPKALEHAVATEKRAQNAYDQWRKHANQRTLAFCVSTGHADFMADFFAASGARCVAVHSGETSAPRTQSLKQLESGELEIVFAVDMFNEGVDVPTIDTVLMLRPTESKILWLQQFGRGLRKAEGKDHLKVIDYVGNHRSFLQVPMILLANASTPGEVWLALQRLEAGMLELPLGCSVEYELQALEILQLLAQPTAVADQISYWYESFREIHGRRPFAVEAYHEGFDPKRLRTTYGSWLSFVGAHGDLDEHQSQAFKGNRAFYEHLETTRMTKSFKMVTLLGMIAAQRYPGSISIDDLGGMVGRVASRLSTLADEFGDSLTDASRMQRLLEDNPINAWIGGKGTGDRSYFKYENGEFRSLVGTDDGLAEAHEELTREICDWRMAQYLDRSLASTPTPNILCKVSHSGGRPILFLPDREEHPGIPEGWTSIDVDGDMIEANFVKVAVNVMRVPGTEKNVLPEILRRHFGEDAGQPGTTHFIRFTLRDGTYHLISERSDASVPEPGHEYMRADIPALWSLEFSRSRWNQGFVRVGGHIFLLVSLNKKTMNEQFQYEDKFLSPDIFQWTSQNRTKQDSPAGRAIRNHETEGTQVHLFVRRDTKTPKGTAAPFTYCGDLLFIEWEGDQPITVRWRLKMPLPESMFQRL